jgi:transketolase
LSKGHCVPVQYAALAMLGVFPLDELGTLKQMGTRLQGHPAAHLLPGIEACTGSLGQGLSFSNGVALASRVSGHHYNVYCLMGDGETQEGQVWEAAMTTSKQCLANVIALVDRNRLKGMDETACGKNMEPYADRWRSFGWAVREIDGHDMTQIVSALDWATAYADGPALVIANTIKGKGISFIEGRPEFHNAALTQEQISQAVFELEANLNRLQEESR